MVGSLLSTWIHYQVLSIPLSPFITFQTEKDELQVDSGKAQEEFAVILERNIFNAQKTQIELPTSLPEEEFVAQINTDGEAVEHTRLNIALAGTMIYGERDSFAFISKKDSLNKYVIYGIGECFHAKTILRDEKCVKESVKILKIRDRWVLILYQEKKSLCGWSALLIPEKQRNLLLYQINPRTKLFHHRKQQLLLFQQRDMF